MTMRDAGERPRQLLALLDAAREAVEAGLEAEGWQLVTLAWQRTRSAREGKAPAGADTFCGRARSSSARGCSAPADLSGRDQRGVVLVS